MLFPIDISRTLLYIAQTTAHTVVSPRPHVPTMVTIISTVDEIAMLNTRPS